MWFSAADWEWALVKSHDQGETWEKFVVPGPQAYPGCGGGVTFFTPCDDSQQAKYNTVADAFLWVDPDTSKIFWSKTYGYALCSSMNMSADDGETWAPVTSFACPGGDYEKIAGGPAPEGGAQPTGTRTSCTRASTGRRRRSWSVRTVSATSRSTAVTRGIRPASRSLPIAKIPGCLHFQEPQVVGPDGTLFLPIGCAADTEQHLRRIQPRRSHDMGLREGPDRRHRQLGGTDRRREHRRRRSGRSYVLWPGADEKLYLAVTDDQGASWSGPFQVSAPGVTTGTPRRPDRRQRARPYRDRLLRARGRRRRLDAERLPHRVVRCVGR